MLPLHFVNKSLGTLLLALASFTLGGFAQQPSSSVSKFPHLPSKIFYFEDTSDVLYHDPLLQNVYRSSNEGKDWSLIEGVPDGEAAHLIDHPTDNQVAFIITRQTTHYATYNRGATWQKFELPAAASRTGSPLSFHSTEKGWIIYQGTVCETTGTGHWGSGKTCWDDAYYTLDAFRSSSKLLLSQVNQCLFAHQSEYFKTPNPTESNSLVYCIAFDSSSLPGESKGLSESRLFSSRSWFASEGSQGEVVDFGIGKRARGIVGLGVAGGFVVAALRKDLVAGGTGGSEDPMSLYGECYPCSCFFLSSRLSVNHLDQPNLLRAAPSVTPNGVDWSVAKFPHGSIANLKENAYTIVESTSHSISIDVLAYPTASIGDLFVSNSNGTEFQVSLQDSNRNARGIVDYENLVGVEGVAVANMVRNREEVVGWGKNKEVVSRITWNDGLFFFLFSSIDRLVQDGVISRSILESSSSPKSLLFGPGATIGRTWKQLKPPAKKLNGDDWECQPGEDDDCSLHLWSVSTPHNFGKVFSSTAPGYVMGIGSVGSYLLPYEDCDTFISTDAGVTWNMALNDASKYEFGDQGSVLVSVWDEGTSSEIKYSFDAGATWNTYDFGVTIKPILLTTVPDSTSQKFLLLGTLSRADAGNNARHALVFLDFADMRKRKCTDKDFEKWYARPEDQECLMGHKQWYRRRKVDADCYVGDKFEDPKVQMDNCPCTDKDFECDFNFVLQAGECVLAGPEPVPAGTCTKADIRTYEGSSGYRLIPGNTCDRSKGIAKDKKVIKDCSQSRPADGQVSHQIHDFGSKVIKSQYLGDSQTVLVQLQDDSIWQSSNEGFTWKQLYPDESFLALTVHTYSKDRAYLVTDDRKVYFTTDTGRNWYTFSPPSDPNGLGVPIFDFHPTKSDWVIWTGQVDCSSVTSNTCRTVSHYSTDNGRKWRQIETYVKSCVWARGSRLKIDEKMIMCESYQKKEGSQRSPAYNPLKLVAGQGYYYNQEDLFSSIVGFTTFSEYLIVAELNEQEGTLKLQVSLDGTHFAEGQFPPGMGVENKAVSRRSKSGDEYGNVFKSNSNGTYFGLSIENANRNNRGYVDFEKMIGLDGVAVLNIVSNPDQAAVSGTKKLKTMITHNDGGSWNPMTPPSKDSLGQPYPCSSTSCALHIHGYTERRDPKATYSSPSAKGLMMAVGNVGENLIGYTDSDTFLTRDAGFTWEEVHKDAHLWEFGDYGSILIIANDEEATDHVLYTTDEGLNWKEYSFGERLRISQIQTVPSDTSRKFLLYGTRGAKPDETVAVHIDFSALTARKCEQKISDPNHDDFELWSPSESRAETCLFGRQTLYHRRIRDRNCFIGERIIQQEEFVRNCTCSASDFECEFNHHRDASGKCVLFPSATALSPLTTEEEQCKTTTDGYWYERTAYRKIPYSSCEGGDRPDRGKRHRCPEVFVPTSHGALFWLSIVIAPFLFAGLGGMWWVKKSGGSSGSIRLGDSRAFGGGGSSNQVIEYLAAIPYVLIGATGAAWAWVESKVRTIPFFNKMQSRRGYRNVPVDDDAEILRGTYDDEE
ncbi:Sortilin and related receptors [Phaffia rhodozyma]|uniref:Vacuolar protein sorting/targeting protein 10 n=1 Tax=Phaffia rhodozyma TaxID=264483 RepID=A0A0F7SM13_PHARH|nr:Sortilin and related receptors [Phaffia rhodozyma]